MKKIKLTIVCLFCFLFAQAQTDSSAIIYHNLRLLGLPESALWKTPSRIIIHPQVADTSFTIYINFSLLVAEYKEYCNELQYDTMKYADNFY